MQRIPVRVRIPHMPGLNHTDAPIAAVAAFLKPCGKTGVDLIPTPRALPHTTRWIVRGLLRRHTPPKNRARREIGSRGTGCGRKWFDTVLFHKHATGGRCHD